MTDDQKEIERLRLQIAMLIGTARASNDGYEQMISERDALRQRCDQLTKQVEIGCQQLDRIRVQRDAMDSDLRNYMEKDARTQQHLRFAEQRCERLETALGDCAKTFREYEEMHRAKGTQDARAKAFANGVMADRCEKALASLPTPPASEPWPRVCIFCANGAHDGCVGVDGGTCGCHCAAAASSRRKPDLESELPAIRETVQREGRER